MRAEADSGLPISAVIITRDAATHLGGTLASVSFCGERLVLDSGSTDGTAAIARAAGARVEEQTFLGYGPQKQRAISLASHDWILSLDADESLDAEAAASIRQLDLSDPTACWSIRRRTFIGNREILHGPWGRERVLRLFNRTTAGFTSHVVHEEVRAARSPGLLPGSILHHSYSDASDVLLRSIRYARLKTRRLREKNARCAAWKLPLRGVLMFAKAYLVQGGWRDGAAGFVIAISRVIDSSLPRAMLLLGEEQDQAAAAEPLKTHPSEPGRETG